MVLKPSLILVLIRMGCCVYSYPSCILHLSSFYSFYFPISSFQTRYLFNLGSCTESSPSSRQGGGVSLSNHRAFLNHPSNSPTSAGWKEDIENEEDSEKKKLRNVINMGEIKRRNQKKKRKIIVEDINDIGTGAAAKHRDSFHGERGT